MILGSSVDFFFYDKIISDDDRGNERSKIAELARRHARRNLVTAIFHDVWEILKKANSTDFCISFEYLHTRSRIFRTII